MLKLPGLIHKPDREYINTIIWPLTALFLIMLFNLLFTENFFKIEIKDGHLFGSVIDIFNRGTPVLLLTIGMTLVYATGGIDLSVAAMVPISGAIAAQIIRPEYINNILAYPDPPANIVLVILIPLAICTLIGLWNGFLVTFLKIQPIIATLIFLTMGRGVAQLISRGQTVPFEHEAFEFLGSGFIGWFNVPVVIAAVIIILTYLLTRKTSLGMFIEAVGNNPSASRHLGIRSKIITMFVYAFSALLAGIAGLIVCADVGIADANKAGLYFELEAIAAVIIGGTVSGGRFFLLGSVIGALTMQSITTTVLSYGVPAEVISLFKAIIIIIVALIQSDELKLKAAGLIKKIIHPFRKIGNRNKA